MDDDVTAMSDKEHGCATCRAKQTETMEVISTTTESVMGGKGTETDTIFRCRTCGANWCKTVERGLGGFGSSWTPVA
jgi:hypothetical protein